MVLTKGRTLSEYLRQGMFKYIIYLYIPLESEGGILKPWTCLRGVLTGGEGVWRNRPAKKV